MNTIELYAGVLLLNEKNQVYLIVEDDRNSISKGRWNLPGGAVLYQEDLVTAAKRASREETGMEVEPVSLIGTYKCIKESKEWVYIVFSAHSSGMVHNEIDAKVKKGKWFEKSEFIHLSAEELVHPDMQLVYNIATEEKGAPIDTVKYIDYNLQ
jgi:ADP-ribose pyrophosphatase YjhB (NUDIX family)